MTRGAALLVAVGATLIAFYVLMIKRPAMAVREALESAADRYGLPRHWLVALGETESGLTLAALNDTGPDALRGGSWGPTQISARTARAFGYTGPMTALRENVHLAADLTARMIAEGFAERSHQPDAPEIGPFKPFRYGTPATFEDLLAIWNAGRSYAELDRRGSTMTTYIPRALEALAEIESEV
jgi:hypothetical protein